MEAHEPLAQALLYQGVFDINAILRMSSDDVKGLNYKDCQGNETHLGMGTTSVNVFASNLEGHRI